MSNEGFYPLAPGRQKTLEQIAQAYRNGNYDLADHRNIAEEAGVSIPTVKRTINGTEYPVLGNGYKGMLCNDFEAINPAMCGDSCDNWNSCPLKPELLDEGRLLNTRLENAIESVKLGSYGDRISTLMSDTLGSYYLKVLLEPDEKGLEDVLSNLKSVYSKYAPELVKFVQGGDSFITDISPDLFPDGVDCKVVVTPELDSITAIPRLLYDAIREASYRHGQPLMDPSIFSNFVEDVLEIGDMDITLNNCAFYQNRAILPFDIEPRTFSQKENDIEEYLGFLLHDALFVGIQYKDLPERLKDFVPEKVYEYDLELANFNRSLIILCNNPYNTDLAGDLDVREIEIYTTKNQAGVDSDNSEEKAIQQFVLRFGNGDEFSYKTLALDSDYEHYFLSAFFEIPGVDNEGAIQYIFDRTEVLVPHVKKVFDIVY